MHEKPHCWFTHLIKSDPSDSVFLGGLFLEDNLPPSFISLISSKSSSGSASFLPSLHKTFNSQILRRPKRGVSDGGECGFLSVSLSANGSGQNGEYVQDSEDYLGQNGAKDSMEKAIPNEEEEEERDQKAVFRGSGALNTTKHLWAGAVSAMVSRFAFQFLFL